MRTLDPTAQPVPANWRWWFRNCTPVNAETGYVHIPQKTFKTGLDVWSRQTNQKSYSTHYFLKISSLANCLHTKMEVQTASLYCSFPFLWILFPKCMVEESAPYGTVLIAYSEDQEMVAILRNELWTAAGVCTFNKLSWIQNSKWYPGEGTGAGVGGAGHKPFLLWNWSSSNGIVKFYMDWEFGATLISQKRILTILKNTSLILLVSDLNVHNRRNLTRCGWESNSDIIRSP